MVFFALSTLAEAARGGWPGVPDAERDGAKRAVIAVLSPGPGGSQMPLRVTGKASSVLVEAAMWEWPERDGGLLASHIAAASAAIAALKAGTDPVASLRTAIVSVSVAAGVVSEASAAASSVGTPERTSARHRPGFDAAGRPSALRRGLREQGPGAAAALLRLATDAASAGASAGESVGPPALAAVASLIRCGFVEIGVAVMEPLGALWNDAVGGAARAAAARLGPARAEGAAAGLADAAASLRAAPACLLPHAGAALAAAAAGDWHDDAAAAVEDDTLDLPSAGLADGAAACLAAAASSPNAALAAGVAARLAASVAALASTSTYPGCPAVTAALAPLAGAGAPPSLVAALRPAASPASASLWFALPDAQAEATTNTLGDLFSRHGGRLFAAGEGGSPCAAASLMAPAAQLTSNAGDPRLAEAMLPVWAALARAGSGAMGPEAAAGALPLGPMGGAVAAAVLRRSLFCPALLGVEEAGAWPGMGLGPWGLADGAAGGEGGRGSGGGGAGGAAAAVGAAEGQWGRDSVTSEEAAVSGEAADDAPQSAGGGAAGAEDGDAASPVHALLSGGVSLGDDVALSAGALASTWLGAGPGAGVGGRTECERLAVSVAALAGMTAAAFPPALAALAPLVASALDAAAGVASASLAAAVRAAPGHGPGGLTAAALVARAASGVPAARDASLLLRCGCALLDAATWRLANCPGWALPADVASSLHAVGTRAAAAASSCASGRAFARGHAWMDLHCCAIAAVASHTRLSASASAPEARPLLEAARGILADALVPPPERLVRAAVAAVAAAVATPSVRAAAAGDGTLAALVGDVPSLTASLSRPARAEVIAVVAAAATAAGGAAGGHDRAVASATAVLGRSVEACAAAAAAIDAAGDDAAAASRAVGLVHRTACHAAADVIGAVSSKAERSDAPVRAALWAVVAPALPALAAVGAAACTPQRFTCRPGTTTLKASALALAAACCSALARALAAFRDRCPAAGVIAVVGRLRGPVAAAVAAGPPAAAAAAAGSRAGAGLRSASDAGTSGGHAGALLRWWVRIVGAALGRADVAAASPGAAWALLGDLHGPLSDAGAGPASSGPACVPLAVALREGVSGLWQTLAPRSDALPPGTAAPFASEASRAAVLSALARLQRMVDSRAATPRTCRAAVSVLAELQRRHRVLSHPEVGAAGASRECFSALVRCALSGRRPDAAELAASLVRREGLREPALAAFVSGTLVPEAFAHSPHAAAIAAGVCRVLFDPKGGDHDLVGRCSSVTG